MFAISRIQSAAFLQWAETLCTGPGEDWKIKIFQTLRPVYGKAPFFFLAQAESSKVLIELKTNFGNRY